ncbi:MAG TPA: HAMP domain-containing sensor histidine kinase [Pseudolabrys sp.]|jgi:signal transduction histidine kinase|nr:HAMP domain-containing sensor histidine kinase [Pseudolabrys sp.]
MFRDLRAGTKFLILCVVSLVLTSVATYALLAEKQIAIDFAHRELVGSKYLALLRPIYGAVLATHPSDHLADWQNASESELINSLSRADAETTGTLHIDGIVKTLAAMLHDLHNNTSAGIHVDGIYLATLRNLRDLAARIGDDSNLTLDPVLDAYHLENIVVTRLPAVLEELGQAHSLVRAPKAANDYAVDREARLIALDSLLRANLNDIANELTAAERGNHTGRLKQFVAPSVTAFASSASAYLDALRAGGVADISQIDSSYAIAVTGALNVWNVAQSELDQLLIQRIDELRYRRILNLILIGTLGALGLLVAFFTYRDMIVPIKSLADLANTVRETKNYSLRSQYESRDEIGRLAAAFNEMLHGLAVAREREIMSQNEITRVSRLATMGAMVASITHEIKQPLAAIVTNAQAGTRWLSKAEPDIDEVRTVLRSIGDEGYRASEVITGLTAIFKTNTSKRVPVDINEVVGDALKLSRGELGARNIALRTKLATDLPRFSADPIQLQEVLLNLIMNAAEAMDYIAENLRVLTIASTLDAEGVRITVEDSGIGIDAKKAEQIFEAFFTTKPTGMGMGLAICRSIIAAHNGRLWASPGTSGGTVFYVFLPCSAGDASHG